MLATYIEPSFEFQCLIESLKLTNPQLRQATCVGSNLDRHKIYKQIKVKVNG